jgi:type I restriction enzyme, R subunit
VHFALDQDNMSMTTHLNNGSTRFLPFNRGRDGGAGNPDVEDEFRIAYLYRDLGARKAAFSREVLLGILHRFVLVDEVEQPDGKVKRTTIWPRFQQLDAVRMLFQDAKANGAGQNYLFQHSAGSGKSNTIAHKPQRFQAIVAGNPCSDIPIFERLATNTKTGLDGSSCNPDDIFNRRKLC